MAKFIKNLTIACSVLALVLFQATALWGGTTGKISGSVVDASTGNPLVGANVVIGGTTLGAAADAEGDYFIINVPPGTYEVTATMIGYQGITMTEVNVDIDHTTPLDFQMSSTVLQAEAVTVTAQREVIKMDESSSVVSASVEEMAEVPAVTDIEDFMLLQAGVLRDQNENLIRGGGLDQQQLMVDGLLVVDNRTNSPILSVNMSSISEMSIIMGGFNAEYGNVRSGMINVVTKEGGQRYSGSLDLRYSPPQIKHAGPTIFDPEHYNLKPYLDPDIMWDGSQSTGADTLNKGEEDEYVFNPADFSDLSNVLVGTDSSGNDIYADLSDYEITEDIDLDWEGRQAVSDYSSWPGGWLAAASGDVDLAIANAAAFLYEHSIDRLGLDNEERTYGDKPDILYDVSLGGPVPVIGGLLGDMTFFLSHRQQKDQWQVARYERPFYEEANTQLKLTSQITPTMKLILEGGVGQVLTVATNANSGSNDGNYVRSSNNGGSMVGRATYYSHAMTNFDVIRNIYGLGLDHTLGDRTFYELRISYVSQKHLNGRWPESEWSYHDKDPTAPPIATIGDVKIWGQPTGGINHNPEVTKGDGRDFGGQGGGAQDSGYVNTLNVKFDITSQVNKYNQVKAGFTYTSDELHTMYRSERYDAPETWSYTEWSHSPSLMGAYIQDKLEFEGMVANIGLRVDANNPNCDWFDTAEIDSTYESGTYAKWFQKTNRESFQDSMPRVEATGNVRVSPRIGVTHPISENAKLYFNYGHTYSMPGSNTMYRVDYSGGGGGIGSIGNPEIEPPRTIQYELGIDANIADVARVRVGGYYRDVTDQPSNINFRNIAGTVSYSTSANRNYQDIRGLEVRIEQQLGQWVSGWFNYDYTVTTRGDTGKATYYEDPVDNALQGLGNPEQTTTLPRPSANAYVSFMVPRNFGPSVGGISILGGLQASLIWRWRAGQYLSWDPLDVDLPSNNLRWPGEHSLDARFQKSVNLAGGRRISVFADITNVLSFEYVRGTFGGGAGTDQDEYLYSLHLPMYKDDAYIDYWVEVDMETGDETLIYPKGYEGTVDTSVREAREFNDKVGDTNDGKPYVNMPNYYDFQAADPRLVEFGLQISF